MNDKLKEAVEKIHKSDVLNTTLNQVHNELIVLLDLATRVLDAEMPERNHCDKDNCPFCAERKAIYDDFTLYFTKKCGELEEVIIRFCDDYYDNKPNDVKVIVHDAFKPLAHTLQSYLLGEKGEK